MDFINQYPYTDFHELNLDYVLTITKANAEALDELQNYDARMDQAEADIISLDGRMDNAESSISSISTTVGQHTNDLISLGTRMTSAENDISTIDAMIYQGRSKTDNQPRVITRFTGGANISDVLDMPPWSFYVAVGPTMQPKLGANFSDTLSNIDYILIKRTYLGFSNGDAAIYDLVNPAGTQHWVGYKISAYPDIQWNKIVTKVDATLTNSGEAADAKTVGDIIYNGRNASDCQPRVMTRYIRENTLTDCRDMPDWSYILMLGSAMQSILGSNFSDTLTANVSYLLKKTSVLGWNGSAYIFDLMTMAGTQHWIGYLVSGMTDIAWNRMPDNATYNGMIDTVDAIAHVPTRWVKTDFTLASGFWTVNGLSTSNYHTNNVPVVPGETLYISVKQSGSLQGVWLDASGNRMGNILETDLTAVDYNIADAINPATQSQNSAYATLWKFTVPANASYISINTTSTAYRRYLANFPVFCWSDYGDVRFKLDDPCASKLDKKLLIIGPSTVYLDRRFVSTLSQYLCAFPEYLAPFYDSVTCWGYDGCPMGDGYDSQLAANNQSIYKHIVTDQVDVSGYDDFIITASSNLIDKTGPGANMGDFWTSPANGNGYIEAVRKLIDYIFTSNPNAHVYVCTLGYGKKMVDNVSRSGVPDMNDPTTDGAIIYQINTYLRAHAQYLGYRLIDVAKEMESNTITYNTYTYDGTHFNQVGNKRLGMLMRKAIIGI